MIDIFSNYQVIYTENTKQSILKENTPEVQTKLSKTPIIRIHVQ